MNVKDGHVQLLEQDGPACQTHAPMNQIVVLVEVARKLQKSSPSLIGAVVHPLLHTHEFGQCRRVIGNGEHVDVALRQNTERLEANIGDVEDAGGNGAVGIDEALEVDVLCQMIKAGVAGMKIDRGDQRDQRGNVLWVESSIAKCERAALT